MVKLDCAICCHKFTRKNLHFLCSNCTADDKHTCSNCWAKLVDVRGIHIDSPRLSIQITCPWCRETISQGSIISHRFAKSYHYYKAIYRKFALATQLLCMDRVDLREAVWHYQEAAELAPMVYRLWYEQRRLRPTRLELGVQILYHNGASWRARGQAEARGWAGAPEPPEGEDDWSNDTQESISGL